MAAAAQEEEDPETEATEALVALTLQDNNDSNNDSVAAPQNDWLTLIPSILQRRHLKCTEQTIESTQALLDQGLLGSFTKASSSSSLLSAKVEESLLESFLEDDYDGKLHLTTLDDMTTSQQQPVGFVFWRELSSDEMREWIHWDHLKQRLTGELQKSLQNSNSNNNDNNSSDKVGDTDMPQQQQQNSGERSLRRSLHMARRESIRWLDVATKEQQNGSDHNNSLVKSSSNNSRTNQLLEQLTHAWVKLELLAVHPDYWGQRIGSLLLVTAMYQAYQMGDNEHMILHIAGGKENVPAVRLYDKFGFLPVPEGTLFHKPDRDLFVLGHVRQTLQRLCWATLEDTFLKSGGSSQEGGYPQQMAITEG